MLEETYYCAFCGEPNATTIDISAGSKQRYVEDCQVCCRPNELRVTIDAQGEAWIETEAESY